MAVRKVFLISQYNSNLLGHIDLTDGSYNAVEHSHTSSIFNLYKVGDSIYAAFDVAGARTTTYLGDGKFGPESDDLGVARPNGRLNTGLYLLRKRYPVGLNTFIRPTSIDANGAVKTYQIVDDQDNILADRSDNFTNVFYPQYPAFELAPGVQFAGGQGQPWYVDKRSIGNDSVYILQGGVGFIDNKMVQIVGGDDGNVYMVKSTFNYVDSTCNVISSTLLGAAVDLPVGGDLIVLPNGEYLFSDTSTRCWKWDGVSAPVELDIVIWNLVERVRTAIADGNTGLYDYENGSEVGLVRRGIETQNIVYIQIPSMVMSTVTMPVISEIPADVVSVVYRNFGIADGLRITSVRTYENPDGSSTFLGALLVEDYSNGTYRWFGNVSAQMQTGRPCPLGRLDEESCIVVEMQPYEVTGAIEVDGGKTSTDLILVDNDSMNIVGRTKADPITGEYKFRCYSNHKKSIFAQHPVSKGLRLASEVTPKLL